MLQRRRNPCPMGFEGSDRATPTGGGSCKGSRWWTAGRTNPTPDISSATLNQFHRSNHLINTVPPGGMIGNGTPELSFFPWGGEHEEHPVSCASVGPCRDRFRHAAHFRSLDPGRRCGYGPQTGRGRDGGDRVGGWGG